MTELVRFESRSGRALLVEVEDDAYGLENISRDKAGVIEAGERLEDALSQARPTIETVVAALKELAPDRHEIEFGIRLSAEAGVVVAKTAVEGHFNIKLVWGGQ